MGKRIDMIGKQFGRWTVLSYAGNRKWHCRCACDNKTEKDVDGRSLRSGLSVSCGCYRKEQRKSSEDEKEKIDLIGKEIGNFRAIEYIGEQIWKCVCLQCGKEVELSRRSFMNGKIKCNCQKQAFVSDLVGKKFGLWEVKSYAGSSKWNCVCECGTEAQVGTNQLIHGKSTKCRKHRNKNNIIFPKWFIEDLYDKSLIGKINTHDIVEFICEKHGVYKQRVGDHIRLGDNSRKYSCPQCSNSINISGSRPENEIIEFIRNNFPLYEIVTHAKILDGKEIDIYIPKLNVGIEYNGSPFHASKNGIYDNKDKYYHRDKFLLAKKNNIHLITIFDRDYDENKWVMLERIRHVLSGNKKFFIPTDSIVYTNNDYDMGDWLKELGYIEYAQLEPEQFEYKSCIVYRCGMTVWRLDK